MYRRIRRNGRHERSCDCSLAPHIAAVILLFVMLVTPMACLGRMMHRYQSFKQDLAESMASAEHRGILSRDEADRFFTLIVDAGMGKPQDAVPDGGGVRYEFDDGSTLELWPVDIDGDPGNPGTLIRYTRADGDVFTYDTDRIDYQRALDMLGLS